MLGNLPFNKDNALLSEVAYYFDKLAEIKK